eukprot:CAMPEP_0202866392 /NCGR_PEP_ID=MMETSP1391-20130828/7440_1 /ASSEMBLY_ACC=CAM_ASM_000867 /TAXON_ID=1034604 /ORGANISM="Chlamydomonas leiostraca, Strain SAG 11-49" /LENGTH=142 /DNA_ID=CAMNT_0049546331 /DNA_START=39 /DNA_END=467 /DNA_ORIENTATION=+
MAGVLRWFKSLFTGKGSSPKSEPSVHEEEEEAYQSPDRERKHEEIDVPSCVSEESPVSVPASEASACAVDDNATPEMVPRVKLMKNKAGEVVGIANTISKYAVHKEVRLHGTPFEERVDRWSQLEQEAAEQELAASAAPSQS